MDITLSSVTVSTELTSISDNTMSSKQVAEHLNEDIQRIVMPSVVLIGVEMALGFVGNLLILYVFGFRYHVCNYKYFVLSLAAIDLLTTVTTMPGEIIIQIYWYVYSVNLVCKVKSFCNVFTLTAEALCLLAIAIDRYRKVCRPLAWQITNIYAKVICYAIPLVACLIALPTPFLWGERTLLKSYGNTTVNVTICEKDEQFKSTNYPMIYISMVNGIVCTILAAMFFSYIYVFGKVIKARRRSKRNKQTHQVGLKLTDRTSPSSDTSVKAYSHEETSDSDAITVGQTSTTSASLQPMLRLIATQKAYGSGSTNLTLRKCSAPHEKEKRVRRKTLIMFIVTLTFIVTAIVYLILVSIIVSENDILQTLNDASKAVYFFFLRLYFINHVINPFIYGFLDREFKEAMQVLISKCIP